MKIEELKYTKEDIITTDGYLSFCNNNNICYIKTDFFYTGQLNWRGDTHPKLVKDSCVVGHSDYPITDSISNKFNKVFCINRSTNNTNTYGIPLGLTNDCDDSPIHKIYGNKEIVVDVFNQDIKKINLAYMSFDTSTYPKERQFLFDKFKNENWVKIGNIDNTIDGRKEYLKEIKSSKFVFCPRGNGIDTHRIWESLYMGSIPIVKYENTHHLFTDLPILFIDGWDVINDEFLNDKYDEISYKDYNMNKLKISYWEEFIKNKINDI